MRLRPKLCPGSRWRGERGAPPDPLDVRGKRKRTRRKGAKQEEKTPSPKKSGYCLVWEGNAIALTFCSLIIQQKKRTNGQ